MSSESYLWIKSTGDGRPNMQSTHLRMDTAAIASQALGDEFVLDTSTGRLKERAGILYIEFGYLGVYTNMPAALEELGNTATRRRIVSLRGFTQFRIVLTVGATASTAGVLGAQYSLDAGANWAGLDNGTAATQSTVTAAITPANTVVQSAWATINTAAAINDILLRLTVSGGDGAEDPELGTMVVEVR